MVNILVKEFVSPIFPENPFIGTFTNSEDPDVMPQNTALFAMKISIFRDKNTTFEFSPTIPINIYNTI